MDIIVSMECCAVRTYACCWFLSTASKANANLRSSWTCNIMNAHVINNPLTLYTFQMKDSFSTTKIIRLRNLGQGPAIVPYFVKQKDEFSQIGGKKTLEVVPEENAGNGGQRSLLSEQCKRKSCAKPLALQQLAVDPQMEKQQIGCMSGIMQLLDKHQILPGKRFNGKRIPAARSPSGCQSPRSASSVDYNDMAATKEPARLSVDSRKEASRSLDFKDVVRDSLQRDHHPRLSIQTIRNSEDSQGKSATKPSDSPRKSTEGRKYTSKQFPVSFSPDRKSTSTVDLIESLESFNKLRESPRKLTDQYDCTEAPRSSFECKDVPRLVFLKDSPRLSCDGRDISRPAYAFGNRDALRCSSLKVRDSSRRSPSSPSKRSPSVVARLMGLEEMPDSTDSIFRKTMEFKAAPNVLSINCKTLDEEKISQDIFGEENPGFNACRNIGEAFSSDDQGFSSGQKQKQVENNASFALDKRRRLIGELENCDMDLQALKKIVETLQLKEGICSAAHVETPIVIVRPAKLMDKCKLPSSSNNSCFLSAVESERFGTQNNLSLNRTIGKKNGSKDQKPIHTTRKNLFSNDITSRKRTANRKCEEFSSTPPHPANRSESSTDKQVLTNVNRKSSCIATKEQRKNSGIIEAKVEKQRLMAHKRQERIRNSDQSSELNIPNRKVKRSLDFGLKFKKENQNDMTETCKTETKNTEKRISEVEIISKRTGENCSEIADQPSPVSVLDNSLYKEDKFSPQPLIKCAIVSPENKDNGNRPPSVISPKPPMENLKLDVPVDVNHSKMLKSQDTALRKPDLFPTDSKLLEILAENICHNNNIFPGNNKLPEFDYVKQIFMASGLLNKDLSVHFHSSGFPVGIQVFQDLEQKHKTPIPDEADCKLETNQRRLVFDTVNVILRRKFAVQPWISFSQKIGGYYKLTGHDLLNLVLVELERLPCAPWEDICDGLCRILQKDLVGSTEQWSDQRTEVGEVVLDLERMLFRELIDETLRDLVFCRRSKSAAVTTTRKQLFFN
eukprot:Gb_11772 [translate_table: standard]